MYTLTRVAVLSATIGFALVGTVALANIVSGSATANISTGTTIGLTTPSGTVANDFLLAQVTVDGGNSVSITPPSGWTLVERTDNGGTIGVASYWKVASASEPATSTWSISPATRVAGGIIRYTNVDTANPIDISGSDTGLSTTPTAPSVTTTADDDQVVTLFGARYGSVFSSFLSTTPGMTKKFEAKNTLLGPTIEAEDVAQASAGTTGSKSVSTGTLLGRRWAAQNIALRMSTGVVFDNAAHWVFNVPTPSFSEPYTVGTISNGILFVYLTSRTGRDDPFTAVTYNGVAMTPITSINTGGASTMTKEYYLLNPAIGTHDVSVTLSSDSYIDMAVSSYAGARQSSQPDAYAAATDDGSHQDSVTTTATTTTAGDFCVSNVTSADGPGAIPSTGISVVRDVAEHTDIGDSNGSVGGADTTYSMTWTRSFADWWYGAIQTCIAPAN